MSSKKEIKHSFGWNALENISRLGIQFLIGVILARLLDASDYGILGIVSVFIAISQTVIDAGFSTAILQKKECEEIDYSTTFIVNAVIGLLLCLLLLVSAPCIGTFYDSEVLTPVLQVIGFSIFIQSLYAVHKVRLTKQLAFKALALITALSSIISGCVAIGLAYAGWGVWALIVQVVASVLLTGICLIAKTRWMPGFAFSWQSFHSLFSFGSKVLTSNILYTLFNNIYNLVIGKFFAPAILGFYTRADGYAKIIPNNISGVLQNIMLPVLSKRQEDDVFLKQAYAKFIRLCSLFIFPSTLLLCALAHPIVILLLTERWASTVELLQILCVASLMDHLITINVSMLMVKGKSDYVLSVSVWTKVVLVVLLVLSLRFGITAVAWSRFLYYLSCFLLSSYYLKKVFGRTDVKILPQVLPLLVISVIVSLVAFLLFRVLPFGWLSLIGCVILAVMLYLGMIRLFLPNDLNLVKQLLKK